MYQMLTVIITGHDKVHASFWDAHDIVHNIFYATLYERKIILWNNTVKENTHI